MLICPFAHRIMGDYSETTYMLQVPQLVSNRGSRSATLGSLSVKPLLLILYLLLQEYLQRAVRVLSVLEMLTEILPGNLEAGRDLSNQWTLTPHSVPDSHSIFSHVSLIPVLSMSEDLTPASESPAIVAEMQISRPCPRNIES